MAQRNMILAGAAILIALAFLLFGGRGAQAPAPVPPPAATTPAPAAPANN